jgi:hypothetical protein
MSETRMPRGDYKKMLFRVPPDVLAFLEERSDQEVRSINAEWVYLLRQLIKKDQAEAQDHQRRLAPTRPRRATTASF